MIIKKIAILLSLFIFGIITEVCADAVKSINNAATPGKIMKMEAKKSAIEKKNESVKEPIKSLPK